MVPKTMLDLLVQPGGPLLGVALGQPTAAVMAALPSWFEKDKVGADQRVSGGIGSSTAGVQGMSAAVEFSLVQASLAWAMVRLDGPDAVEPAYLDICAAFDASLGQGTRSKKKKELLARWDTQGAFPGELTLKAGSYHVGDGFSTFEQVELAHRLAEGVTLQPVNRSIAWLDTARMAEALATADFPEATCRQALDAFFAYDDLAQAQAAKPRVGKELVEIYKAARKANPDARPVIEKLLAAYDWKDIEPVASDSRRLDFMLWKLCHQVESMWDVYPPNGALFIKLNLADLKELVSSIAPPVAERAAWAWKVVNAAQFADAQAAREVSAALAPLQAEDMLPQLALYATPELDERLFAVTYASLTPEEMARFVVRAGHDPHSLHAATRHLAQVWALPAPATPARKQLEDVRVEQWSAFLAVVRAHDETLFLDLLEKVLELFAQLYGRTAQDICEALRPDQRKVSTSGKGTWGGLQVGLVVFTRSDPSGTGRGRVSVKRHATLKAAAADFAKKSAGK